MQPAALVVRPIDVPALRKNRVPRLLCSAALLVLSGCASEERAGAAASTASTVESSHSRTPTPSVSLAASLARACGTRGQATVPVNASLLIPHAQCDLSGVTITIEGGGGAVVPDKAGYSVTAADVGPDNSILTLAVAPVSSDLTITVSP